MGYIQHHNSAAACRCPHPACNGAGQPLNQVFLACVVARPVVAWLAQVWERLPASWRRCSLRLCSPLVTIAAGQLIRRCSRFGRATAS